MNIVKPGVLALALASTFWFIDAPCAEAEFDRFSDEALWIDNSRPVLVDLLSYMEPVNQVTAAMLKPDEDPERRTNNLRYAAESARDRVAGIHDNMMWSVEMLGVAPPTGDPSASRVIAEFGAISNELTTLNASVNEVISEVESFAAGDAEASDRALLKSAALWTKYLTINNLYHETLRLRASSPISENDDAFLIERDLDRAVMNLQRVSFLINVSSRPAELDAAVSALEMDVDKIRSASSRLVSAYLREERELRASGNLTEYWANLYSELNETERVRARIIDLLADFVSKTKAGETPVAYDFAIQNALQKEIKMLDPFERRIKPNATQTP
jgi:hypothetical protein